MEKRSAGTKAWIIKKGCGKTKEKCPKKKAPVHDMNRSFFLDM